MKTWRTRRDRPWNLRKLLPATGSFGPSGAKFGKRVGKWVPWASRPGAQKSRKRSRKRVKMVEKHSILSLFRLRLRLFGPRGREVLRTHFPILFPTLGPEGPNDPCGRARESQHETHNIQAGRKQQQATSNQQDKQESKDQENVRNTDQDKNKRTDNWGGKTQRAESISKTEKIDASSNKSDKKQRKYPSKETAT